MTIKQTLIDAKALITDPDKWTQGVSARKANGEAVGSQHKEACQFCALGAVRRAHPPFKGFTQTVDVLEAAAVKLGSQDVVDLNDHSDHPRVMEMFDLAIKECEE